MDTTKKADTGYYSGQLAQIIASNTNQYPFNIQVSNGDGAKTKWMQINEESAAALIEFLKKVI